MMPNTTAIHKETVNSEELRRDRIHHVIEKHRGGNDSTVPIRLRKHQQGYISPQLARTSSRIHTHATKHTDTYTRALERTAVDHDENDEQEEREVKEQAAKVRLLLRVEGHYSQMIADAAGVSDARVQRVEEALVQVITNMFSLHNRDVRVYGEIQYINLTEYIYGEGY